MKRHSLSVFARAFAFIAVAGIGAPAACTAQSQHMAVPAYFEPGPLWTKLQAAAPTVGIAILNPASGPGTSGNPIIAGQVARAQARGIRVLGYVYTGYGHRPIADVEQEAGLYLRWYRVNGILFDCAANTPQALPNYRACYKFVKAAGKGLLVAINPGCPTMEVYMQACDIVCSFEGPLAQYELGYQAPAWVSDYPASRFWHVVFGVTTVGQMRAVIALIKKRRAGWVFVTPLKTPNPYDGLPSEPYWSDELAAISGVR